MRTSRLLLGLGAIQLLIMFTCIALPSMRLSSQKRSTNFASRLPSSSSSSPSPSSSSHSFPFVWHLDEQAPALHASMAVKMRPYDLWLIPPTPSLRYVQPPQQQQQQQQPSSDESGSARSKSPSQLSRKLNPKYAMKFNEEALKQQQQQQSDGTPPSPSGPMFQSRLTFCAGSVNFRCRIPSAAVLPSTAIFTPAQGHHCGDAHERGQGDAPARLGAALARPHRRCSLHALACRCCGHRRIHALPRLSCSLAHAPDDVAAHNMTRWLQRVRPSGHASGGWCIVVLRAAQPQAISPPSPSPPPHHRCRCSISPDTPAPAVSRKSHSECGLERVAHAGDLSSACCPAARVIAQGP